jgi:hypothetical protein
MRFVHHHKWRIKNLGQPTVSRVCKRCKAVQVPITIEGRFIRRWETTSA